MIQSGSDKAAIAWAIAKNIEQSSGFEYKKQFYKDGILDGKNPDDDITEDYKGQIPPGGIILDINKNGDSCNSSGDFITNMEKGFYVKNSTYDDPNANYLHIYYYPIVEEAWYRGVGTLYFDLYNSAGEITFSFHPSRSHAPGEAGNFFRTVEFAPEMSYDSVNLILDPSGQTKLYSNTINGNGKPFVVIDWDPHTWQISDYISGARYISTTPFTPIDIN